MYNTITLREAIPNDVPLLQHWDEQLHVIAAIPNNNWEWKTALSKNYAWRELLITEHNGRLLLQDPGPLL